jgi:hypothetical protein
MNKKIYVTNFPFQAGEPELKALFSKDGDVRSVKIVKDRQTGKPRRVCFRGDVNPMGSPDGCFHAESDRSHGGKFAGKRGESQPWLSREMAIKI